MKTAKVIALVAAAGLLASCSNRLSTKQYYDDDIYFSSKDLRNYTPPALYQQSDSGSYAPSNRNSNSAAATPNYQNGQQVMDDYYDYQYASRIRRFYNPSFGMGYFDPYYTNTYWYNYNPYSFGTSVYTTYNFWPNSYNYWGFGNQWGYNPWANNPYWGYNNFGWNGWGNSSPWMPYNPYACGWGYGNPYWGYGGWGFNNNYFNGYNNGYYDGYNNGFNDGFTNNYYFNGFDNNSYTYYGPYKQTSSSGKFNSFGEQVQTAMNNDGAVFKFSPGIGAPSPTNATTTKPMNFNPATPGSKGNANTNAPGIKNNVSDINAPANLGEKNTPVNVAKPNNGKNPAEGKPTITGKPIQVFDYNEAAPAGNKGNLGTVNPNQGKQQVNPAIDERPTQKPAFQDYERQRSVEPVKPSFNERPSNVEPVKPNFNERPQQSKPNFNNDRPRNNNNNYNSAPQQRPQTTPQRNETRPRSENINRPQNVAPQNNNRNSGGGFNSAPSGGGRGNMGSGGGNSGGNNGGGRGNAGNPGGGRSPR